MLLLICSCEDHACDSHLRVAMLIYSHMPDYHTEHVFYC